MSDQERKAKALEQAKKRREPKVEVGAPKIEEAQNGDVLPGLNIPVESDATRTARLQREDRPVQEDPVGNAIVGGLGGAAAGAMLPAEGIGAPGVLKYGKEIFPAGEEKTASIVVPKLAELNAAAAQRLAAKPPLPYAEGGEVGRKEKALAQAKARRAGVPAETKKLSPMAELNTMVSHLKDPDVKEFEPNQHPDQAMMHRAVKMEAEPLEMHGAKYEPAAEVALAKGGEVPAAHPQGCACGQCLARGGFTKMQWREPHQAHVVHAARIIVDHHMQALAEGGPVAAAIPPAVQDGQPPMAAPLPASAPGEPEVAAKDAPLVQPERKPREELEQDPHLKQIEDERQKEVSDTLHPGIGLQVRRSVGDALMAFGHLPLQDHQANDERRAAALNANAKDRSAAYAQSVHGTGLNPNSRRTQALSQAFGRVTGQPDMFQGLDESQLGQIAPLVSAVQKAQGQEALAKSQQDLMLGIHKMQDETTRRGQDMRAKAPQEAMDFKEKKQADLLEGKAIQDGERIYRDPAVSQVMQIGQKAKATLAGIADGSIPATEVTLASLKDMLGRMETGGVASEHAAKELGIESPFMGLRRQLAKVSEQPLDFQNPQKILAVYGPLLESTEKSIEQFQKQRLRAALGAHVTQVPQDRLDVHYKNLAGEDWQHEIPKGAAPPPL